MLKLKSAFLGFVVCFPTSQLLSGTTCFADSEALPDAGRLKYEIPVGSEKACGDHLPSHGVSFPTQLYTNHLAAYNRKVVLVTSVDAGRLKEIPVIGRMKASASPDQSVEDNQLVATLFPFESLPPESRSGDAPQQGDLVASVDEQLNEKGLVLAENLPSDETEGQWRASGSRNRVSKAGKPESGNRQASPELQTVAFQEFVPAPVPAADSASESQHTDSEYKGDTVSGKSSTGLADAQGDGSLFRTLDKINLSQSIRSASELPDSSNPGREYFEKAGSQNHWRSGNWVSFRPKRNTYPFQHNPLYFEDPNLERCGRSCGYLTELASVAHFAGRIPVLPYMMTVEPPCSLVAAKPDCPSCHKFGPDAYFPRPDEVDLGGAAIQTAAIVGLIFLIP